MAVSNIVVNGINPNLNILGDTQKFVYTDVISRFGLINNFIPIQNVPSIIKFDFSNNLSSGYRFDYTTTLGDTLGVFKLKSFLNNAPVGDDVFTVTSDTFTFNRAVVFATPPLFQDPTQNLHAANKQYVDNHTWVTANITDFDAKIKTYKLNDFLSPVADISLGNFKIVNLANPINPQDAATKSYVDTTQKTVILNGAVSGSGLTGSAVTTTFNLRLDEIAISTANINLNNNKIINLATPTLSTDAVNKSYVDTKTIDPSKISGYPVDSTKYLSGDGTWNVPSGGSSGSGDTYQTLASAASVTWTWASGNIAAITLTTNVAFTITTGTATRGILIVKQDAIGGRTITLPAGIYRQGTTNGLVSLTGTANSIDVFQFFKGASGEVFVWNTAYQFVAVASSPTNKYIFVYDGSVKTLTIPVSANNVCRIKVLGAGGGQGLYNGGGSSGAGGYTVFHFNTTNYIGQEIKLIVGGGGGGATSNPGQGGYPNGGRGVSGDTRCGGGGGRSDVRIGANTVPFSSATFVAIAGGGGGGTGYSGYGGAGGGSTGQQSQNTSSTAGSQTSGGISATNPPAQFQQAGFLQGAGATVNLTGEGYDTGGGGDGYYGGGCSGGDGQASSGGSGYINIAFTGYLASYGGVSSGTFTGNQTAIPTQASSDKDFQDGSGVGRLGGSGGTPGMNGGNGKIIVEFL